MLLGFFTTAIVGVIIIIIGINNMRGDISSLHSYHRSRVKPEDVRPFGKLVGLGTIIMGISCIVMGASIVISDRSGIGIIATIGGVLMGVGFAIGIAITAHAMKKYNGGMF